MIGRFRRRSAVAGPWSPAGDEAAVEARGVTYTVGHATLVDGVDLAVRPGELVAVLGPNGAGKSTLLGLLAGDLRPGAGSVRVAGLDPATAPAREVARRRAVLPQQVTLAFPFTVTEVVRMGRAPHDGPPEDMDEDELIARCLAETDTAHLAHRAFPSLSGGERSRVSLARVLAQQAPVLLLDEPTAALDLRHTEDVLRLARARADAGDAVVAVLHDIDLAAAWADRVMLMASGRVVACGTPDEVYTAELLGDLYGHPVEVLRGPGGNPLVVPVRPERERMGAWNCGSSPNLSKAPPTTHS